jgi:hypothetical protein
MKKVLYLILILIPLRAFAFPTLETVTCSVQTALENELKKVNDKNEVAIKVQTDLHGLYDKNAYSNFKLMSVKTNDKLSSPLMALEYLESCSKRAKDIHFRIDNPNGPKGYYEGYEYSCTVIYSETYFEIDDCDITFGYGEGGSSNTPVSEYDTGVPLQPKYGGILSQVYLEGDIL